LPPVFITGAGATARHSVGLVLVGGLTIGTVLPLFIVPSLYVLLAKPHQHDNEIGVDVDGHNIGDAQALPEFAMADGNGRWRDGNGA